MSLDEMQARCDAATPGPWRHEDRGGWAYPAPPAVVGPEHKPGVFGGHQTITQLTEGGGRVWGTVGKYELEQRNAAFIAHARTDMPRLIAALRVAMEGLERANAALDETFSHFNKSSLQVVAGTQLGIAAALARVTAILEGK